MFAFYDTSIARKGGGVKEQCQGVRSSIKMIGYELICLI